MYLNQLIGTLMTVEEINLCLENHIYSEVLNRVFTKLFHLGNWFVVFLNFMQRVVGLWASSGTHAKGVSGICALTEVKSY